VCANFKNTFGWILEIAEGLPRIKKRSSDPRGSSLHRAGPFLASVLHEHMFLLHRRRLFSCNFDFSALFSFWFSLHRLLCRYSIAQTEPPHFERHSSQKCWRSAQWMHDRLTTLLLTIVKHKIKCKHKCSIKCSMYDQGTKDAWNSTDCCFAQSIEQLLHVNTQN